MTDNGNIVQSVVFERETHTMMTRMAKEDERTNSALVRWLIRQEYARRYSTPQPLVTIEQAQAAGEAIS